MFSRGSFILDLFSECLDRKIEVKLYILKLYYSSVYCMYRRCQAKLSFDFYELYIQMVSCLSST